MNLKPCYPLYLAGKPVMTAQRIKVRDKYRGTVLTEVSQACDKEIESAIQAAALAQTSFGKTSTFFRKQVLKTAGQIFREQRNEFAQVLCAEVGKPIRDAETEVARFIDTFEIAFEECGRVSGEVLPLDRTEKNTGYLGFTRRVPIGPCLFISPFNFPLNLTAHKIAPALATGCPFILKPASRTPVTSLLIGEVLESLNLPLGTFSILPSTRELADRMISDDRLKLLSFTGSPAVGWEMKQKSGKKKVVLELGGNAACIVDESAEVEKVVARLLIGTFAQTGQSCISVQRIYIHRSRYEEVKQSLVKATEALHVGDPSLAETQVGPLIDESEAERLEKWILTAREKGARILCGGTRRGAVLLPTLLENVPPTESISCEEAFGPVAVLEAYDDFDKALQAVNQSRFGLQTGIFTSNWPRIRKAWETLEVGGIVVNDVPSWRADQMPYGGVKDSGLGREGIRYAMDDMTEIRLLILKD